MKNESRKFLAGLRRQMDLHFNLDEIELLCFDLNIDYEHLAGSAKPKKIHNLVLMVVRHGHLPGLLELLNEERPGVTWPEPPPDFDPAPLDSLSAEETLGVNQVQIGDVGAGATAVGHVGEGGIVAGTGATVVGAGGSLNVQNYQISGAIAGNLNIAGDVHIVADELPIPAPPAPERLPVIADFVGREPELAHFSETLRTTHLAVISGMAGIGKTALAAVLARQAALPENIFWHTFHQGEGVEAIIWRLAGFLAGHGQDDLWQLLQRTRLTHGNLPPNETLLDYLRQLLRSGDFLLCLDDLHLVDSDPQMNLFVERARTAVLAGELSLIITSRRLPEYVTIVETAFIAGLTLAATQQMLQNRGVDLAPDLVVKLHNRTQGNAELLTLAIEMLRQAQYPERLLDNLAEARDVERFLLSEIDAHLSEFEPDVMSAVSVLNLFGHMGTRYAIAAILEGQNVRRVLRDLSDRFLLIVRRHEEGNEYGQHALVQAFYYDTLSRRQRQALHRLAGTYYQDEEPNPMRAAIHFERAGEIQKAIQLVSEKLWELINLGHSPALRELTERFQPQQIEPAAWLQIKMVQGELYAFLGESEAAEACYQEVLSQLAAQPETDAVRRQRVRAYRGLGELLQQESPQKALTWLRRGLATGITLDPTDEAGIHIAIGTIHMWLVNYEEAAPALEKGLSLLSNSPSQLRATALENLGVVAIDYEHDFDKGIGLTHEALQISQTMRDHFKSAEIMTTLGIYLFNAGDWPGGMTTFRQALNLAEQIGSNKATANVEITLGVFSIDFDQENLDVAQSHLEKGLHLARQTEQQVDVCIALLSLVDLKLYQSQWEAAADFLAEAEQLTAQLEDQLNAAIIQRSWALIKLAQGDIETALADAKRAVDMAQEVHDALELGINWRVLGQVSQAVGRHEAALEAYQHSHLILEADYPFETARTQMEWGSALLETGNVELGRSLLGQARDTFRRLGAQRDLATTEQQLRLKSGD